MSKTTRIAIVGAGPAGLTAAVRLKELGYDHVKVFEKQSRVGGKCATVTIDGRNYELGAAITGRTTYRIVNRLVKDHKLTLIPFRKTQLLSTREGGPVSKLQLLKNYGSRIRPAIKKYLE